MSRITLQGRDWNAGTHRDTGNVQRKLRDMPMAQLEPRIWWDGIIVGVTVFAMVVLACLVPA